MSDPRPEREAQQLATHIAYADEAQYNFGRHRGVGVVSLRRAAAVTLGDELRALVSASNVKECKWEKLRSARMRFAAEKLISWALDHATAGALRVDVLTWDVDDRLHSGHGPHYLANLRQMYLRILTRTLASGWPSDRDAHWLICPDEQDSVHWQTLVGSLPAIVGVLPAQSHREPLIQVADLFTGMAVFSRDSYDLYERWLCLPESERDAPSAEDSPPERLSGSVRQRCLVLDSFFTQCKRRQLGVSLRTQRGLRTYDFTRPINFWWHTA